MSAHFNSILAILTVNSDTEFDMPTDARYLSKLGIKVGDTASIVTIVLEWLHLLEL